MALYYCYIITFCALVTNALDFKSYQDQPKLYIVDGHLHIKMPEDKEILFHTSKFRVNNQEVVSTLKGAQNATKLLQNYEKFISQYHSRMDDIESRLVNIRSDSLIANTTNITQIEQTTSMRWRRVERKVTMLQRRISNLQQLLSKDECSSNPCKHGGVCLDLYNGFLCQCQSGWEGPTCELDIDECSRFTGTDLGCQNGGTCQNSPGTYQCYCQEGWIGIHCNRRPTDCNTGGSEICGHGTCIPQNNKVGYKCLCDPGWTTDDAHTTCSVDVDECKLPHPPCSTNPLVLCTNVPGSFVCQHCPPGYTGNGYYCADVNECDLFNGGCSVSPFVQCINIPGSSKCGQCPPGYQGDGKSCSYRGICNTNNGGCSLLARCAENPAISDSYVQCICPAGYTGSGMGPNGCFKSNFSSPICTPNPCIHGTCMPSSEPQGFSCICNRRYSGNLCDREEDPCAVNPCLNGGTCQKRRGRFICKCPNGFSGKTCNKEQEACGGTLTLPNGTLTYPPSNYAMFGESGGVSCAWIISTNESMVIHINFTKFNIPSDSSCSTQWLQIHDGRNTMAPPLGRHCGSSLPRNGSLTTTHNIVYLWLKTNENRRAEFELTWNTKQPDCGGMIEDGHGILTSPGWPSNYPNNRNCYWYFKVPIKKRLLFHVYSLNIGQYSDCSGDYLEFYATNTIAHYTASASISRINTNKELFASFCNSTIPEPFFSPLNEGYIHFKSNEKDTYSGFQIGYSTVHAVPGCGGTYTNQDGYIQSIEMTRSMPSHLTCVYEIKFSSNTTIKIEFVDINLDNTCTFSMLEILKSSSEDSGSLGKYCGSNLPGPVVTYGNRVLIKSTQSIFHKSHWKIKYESICTDVYRDPVGSIPSLNRMAGECIHRIEQPVGSIIILELQLNRYFYNSRLCLPFFIEVRDGDNENSTLIDRYCTNGLKVKLESSTNHLWIKAVLSSTGLGGFSANYTTLDMGCGGLLKKPVGSISYPTHGGKYSGENKCRWVILAPSDKVIQLNWMTFNLEQSYDCTYDHVQLFDNNTVPGMGGPMGRFCGYTLPPLMMSTSNIITIDFVSDVTVHGDGFLVSYTFIQENNVCGANYYTSAGTIKSPGYPNNYPSNRECIWVITVLPGRQIMLNFTDFNIEAYSGCRYDWLEIRNGGTSSSPLMGGRLCGTTIPKLPPSHSNKLFLKFNSDNSRVASGFKIQWTSAATGCGGTLTSPSGSIMSPHYPEPYTKNTDCLWKIVVSAGSLIQIIFADIDLEYHSVCGLDYVQLLDGSTINSQSLGKFCAPQKNPVMSTGNTMLVRFRSDVSFQGRGFSIQYSEICTNTLTGFGGVIESPNFPNDYPQDQNCVWTIKVAENNKINITFSHFALERSTTHENKSCHFDYVEIEYQTGIEYNGMSEEPQFEKYGRYCGFSNPGLITINSNTAKVHFVSDSLLLGTGFRLEWKIFGCGGILSEPSGKITSPNYPKRYPRNVECNWIITVPLGKSIAITFSKVDVEKDNSCNFDYIKIYNGKDATYQLIATICHQLQETKVASTGNNMFIQFKTDSSDQGTGFEAYYRTEATNCGGELTATSGYILSPNYPKNYNRNETCEWLITTADNHLLELQFEDVDLPKNCNKTYIKIYDGPNQAYPLLSTICGNSSETNHTIRSTFENLFIEFRSDSYMTSKGFLAKYEKACGATITTAGSGTLHLRKDHAPSANSWEVYNCTYTIQAADKSNHVTLSITYLNHDGWCDDYNNLTIFNGPFSDSPVLGSFCETKTPLPVISDGSALHLEFRQAMDFYATYSILDNQCGGELISNEGYFATPGWPKKYPQNIQCEWTISVGPGNTINLNFLNLSIPESPHCNTDFLEIRETNSSGKLIKVLCGSEMPSNLTANGKMYLLFKSSTFDVDGSDVYGFYAEYGMSTRNELTGPEGFIASPNYPQAVLTSGSYSWLVTTTPGTRIEITFIELVGDVDREDDDCYGSPLYIYDGMDSETNTLYENCMSGIPAPAISSSNMVYINLEYYSSRVEYKFLLKWKELLVPKKTISANQTDCQFAYLVEGQTNVTITSPGYPAGYAPNLNCEWIFDSPPAYHLSVVFQSRDLGTWSSFRTCTFADVIRVYQKLDKNADWDRLREFCNNSNVAESIIGTNLMKIEFQTNKYLNGSGFQATILSVCGGTLTGPSGSIVYSTNSLERECQWNITVKSGRTIKLTFGKFDLSPNDNCRNYVIIRNGKFSDSPYLGDGKFCGPDSPEPMESTSNHLYIKYQGRNKIKGFTLNYEEVSIDCGQYHQLSVENPSVEISSPNYPNVPPTHIECVWTFRAPTGEALRVDFEERFDVSNRPACNKDYVEIRNGGTELSPPIGTFCYGIPSTQFSTDNMLRMKYFTDSDEPRNGFKAKISIAYCGGTYRGLRGNLTTTEPHIIKAGSNCTWHLKAPMGYYFILKFPIFQVSPNAFNCSKESVSKVQIRNYNTIFGNDTSLGTFCGRINKTKEIRTDTNEVSINYMSTSDKDEFTLSYRAIQENCGQNLVEETGTITSPGYPHSMNKHFYCFWSIKVPKGRRISIHVDDADIEGTYLSIIDGYTNGPKLQQITDGRGVLKAGQTFESSDNGAYIVYWQELQTSKRGFKLTYTSDQPSICTGEFNNTYGEISAPQISHPYKCEWTHEKSETETLAVKIILETNNTKQGPWCHMAQTGIHLYTKNHPLAKLCQSSKDPVIVRTPFRITSLTARKNVLNTLNFTVSYKTYKCGGIINNEQGTISSPNFPNSPQTSMECSWALTLVYNKIKINITTLNLGNDCDKSYLIIYNGKTSNHPKTVFCKNTKPDLIISQSNNVVIDYRYEEGGDGSSKGFSLNYEPESQGCGGIYQTNMDVITTPQYDKDYPNNAECLWEIRARDGYLIKFKFFDRFYIEESENCVNDYVEVFDWKDEAWVSLGKKCGRNLPNGITSSSTQLKILFRSNDKIAGSGFKAKWEWHCGGELEASNKERYLMSPGYPGYTPANCTYKIVTKRGRGIVNIKFLDFDLEKGQGCTYSNLSITGTISGRAITASEQVFCGKTKPPNQRFKDSVVIVYKNRLNMFGEVNGFKLAYKDESCGGNITKPTIIEAPGTNNDLIPPRSLLRLYQPRISCNWYITAPSNQIPVLSIQKLGMTVVINCFSQALEVYDGLLPIVTKRLAVLCGKIEETKPISSNSNTMLVRIEASPMNFDGFKGEIYFTYGPSAGCGGRINLTDTKSLNAPNNLPHMDCHWTITAPRDQKIQLEFTKINIPGACNNPVRNHTHFCTCSFIEVRDGGGPFAEPISKLCSSDNNLQRTYTTSWNTAYIRLYSAAAQNDMFSVTLKPVQSKCGPSELTVTKELKELLSPNYPNSYPDEIKCTWVLTNPKAQGKVLLHFEDFDLLEENFTQTTASCEDDRLLITDDPNRQIISEGYGPTAKYHLQMPLYSRIYYNQYNFCGKDIKPFDFYSAGNTVTISFTSYNPSGKKGRGFKLKYGTSGCNRTINANEGQIQSSSEDNNNCIIIITADENKTLSLYFSQFYFLYSNSNCSQYGLEIRENNSTGTQLLKGCGFRTPNPVFANTNQVYIRAYNHRSTPTFSQYNLLFVASEHGKGCGGDIFNFKGKFTSPMYPTVLRQETQCTWNIKVPRGYKVALKFSEFDIGGPCTMNKVVVTTYNDDNPTEREFCSQDTPAILYSDAIVQVKYYSTVNNGGNGWVALFKAVKEESDPVLWF